MSNRAIGRELGLYKVTVNKYVGLAEADPLSLDELLKFEYPVLVKRLCHQGINRTVSSMLYIRQTTWS